MVNLKLHKNCSEKTISLLELAYCSKLKDSTTIGVVDILNNVVYGAKYKRLNEFLDSPVWSKSGKNLRISKRF